MYRYLIEKLLIWKNNSNKKPLILEGARQVGKTWLMVEFAKNHYEDYLYINFESDISIKQIFENDLNIDNIVQQLSIYYNKEINPNKTLILFDEIQECPRALTSLKYFNEHKTKYSIIASGSLLGIALNKGSSFPVGKIELLKVYPMSFSEFLIANNQQKLVDYLNSIKTIEKIPETTFKKLKEYLEIYYFTGGLPEAIHTYIDTNNLNKVKDVLNFIVSFYKRDFIKYLDGKEINKINLVFDSLPNQLSKENKKFSFNVVKKDARSREYINSIQWLIDIHLIYKIYKNTGTGIPIKAYNDMNAFKLYMCDVGILNNIFNLSISSISIDNYQNIAYFKGSIAENFILQSIINLFNDIPSYWSMLNPNYEIDFLIQYKDIIIPIEVKSGENIKNKSLNVYKEKHKENTPLRIRYSLNNLSLDGDILNIPLFMVDYTIQLIEIALKNGV